LTSAAENELLRMVTEIYHHLGLDGSKPISINDVKIQAQKDVLRFQEKKRKGGYGLAKT